MIKYLGSKRVLVPTIQRIVAALPDIATACDPFTGTTRVAQALKSQGIRVHANDLADYAATFARAYIEADAATLPLPRIQRAIDHLNSLPGIDGYVTETWCRRSRFFQPANGMRIDAMRAAIDELAANAHERAILLTSLIEAADRVDSTTGVQMAFLKSWAARSNKPIELRLPELLAGGGTATCMDAADLGTALRDVDLVYLDPPYNQHSYHANYHIWETLARGDEPEVYGVACKRVDIREVPSDFNSSPRANEAFERVVARVEAPWLLVSFSDEGFLKRDTIERVLGERRDVGVLAVPNKRYVGAQIGIHNPAGDKVGTVSHVTNTEYLFLAGPDRAIIDQAMKKGTTLDAVPSPT